jgi:methyltransferase (TIGR00027 family)
MANNNVSQKPSETALFAALRRALANKKYPQQTLGSDYLADSFLPLHFRFFLRFPKIQQNTAEKLNEALPGLTEYMIARTVYFDELFKKGLLENIPQIVLMGAGYDTRAFRFAELNQGTRIYELDISPTQDRKKDCLRKAKIKIPAELKLIPINFNSDSLLGVLTEAGWNSSEKTLFIWEGVSYYLEEESVTNTLEFFNQHALAGSNLAFDYTISLTDENITKYYGAAGFKRTMEEHHTAETLLFSIPESGITKYLADHHLKIIENLGYQEIEQKYLIDEDGNFIGQMTGHFCFVVVTK